MSAVRTGILADDGEDRPLTVRARLPFRLLVIGDRQQARVEPCSEVFSAGGDEVAILLREPGLPPSAMVEWGAALLPLCRSAGARLLIHGDPEAAALLGADGVHLAENDSRGITKARALIGPERLVGASRHEEAGVWEAGRAGADYVTLSPIYATPGKGTPLGVGRLSEIAASSMIPVVALGGITGEGAEQCRGAGAAAVAAIRFVWQGEPGANVRRLLLS